MKNHSLLTKIASVANELDYAGFTKEAKALDNMMLKLAEERYPDDLPVYKVLVDNLYKYGFGLMVEKTPTDFLNMLKTRQFDNPDLYILEKALSHTDEEYPEYYKGAQAALIEFREGGPYTDDLNRQFLVDCYKTISKNEYAIKSRNHAYDYLANAKKGGNTDYVKEYEMWTNPRPDLGLF